MKRKAVRDIVLVAPPTLIQAKDYTETNVIVQ